MMNKRVLFLLAVACGLLLAVQGVPSAYGQAKAKDTIILKGAPMGGVKFEHKMHSETYAEKKCETCHHANKPEKAATAPQEACFTCHMTPAKAPMKTNRQGAFHNPVAKAGTCIDCHLAQNAKGKKAPTKCLECHKKENI